MKFLLSFVPSSHVFSEKKIEKLTDDDTQGTQIDDNSSHDPLGKLS